jgi:hypothetical protein
MTLAGSPLLPCGGAVIFQYIDLRVDFFCHAMMGRLALGQLTLLRTFRTVDTPHPPPRADIPGGFCHEGGDRAAWGCNTARRQHKNSWYPG